MAVWSKSTLIDAYLSRRIDSEFFRPAYVHVEQQTRRCNAEDLSRLGRFIPGPFGSAFHVKNYDFQSPYRYLRGRDIKPFFILDDDNRYVPEADFKRLKDYAVQHDDLMISVVGTLGNVAVCTSYDTPAIFSCKSTLFRSFGANPYYLLAYLNCHQGQLCLLRRQRGAVQTGLNIEDLKTIPIPRFDNEVESEIASNVRFAHKVLRDSKEHYTQAQFLLESELGLDKLNFQKPVGYTMRFSELKQSRRVDAEFFQPKYQAIVSLIHNRSHTTLGGLFSVSRGICLNPNVYNDIDGVPYIRIKELSLTQPLVPENSVKIPHRLLSKKFPTSISGDYILAVIGATIGKINLIDETMDGSLYSNNTACLSPKSRLDWPNAMELILRSPVVQHQIQQRMAKTAQEKITDPELKRILIPHLDSGLMLDLEKLCSDSKKKYFESKRLLNQAKTRVEQLIEEAVRS